MRRALILTPSRSSRSSASQHGGRVGAEIDEPSLAALVADGHFGLRHQLCRSIEFAADAVEHTSMDAPVFRIARVLVVRRAAREEGALGRMRAGQRAIGDGVAVDVLVSAPVPAL